MLIFQFLNDKIHNYVLLNIIVNFIIQKLKNKHTFLKKPQKVITLLSLASKSYHFAQYGNLIVIVCHKTVIRQSGSVGEW